MLSTPIAINISPNSMQKIATIITAFRALRLNWGRSLLTILGILIGVIAIVLVISLGEGAKGLILNEVASIGANALIIRPGRQPDNPSDIASSVLSDSLKANDIEALKQPANVPGLASVNPAVLVAGEVTYEDNAYRPTTFGWTPDAMEKIFNISPVEGTYFTEDDIHQQSKVAVIGAKVKDELFGSSSALGKNIKIKGQNMRVIGIFPPTGQILVFNVDDVILLPYSTAQKTLLGIDYFHEVFAQVKPGANIETTANDIRLTLREQHDITDPKKDDFFVLSQKDIQASLETITSALTIFLVAIASISLLVGGVGIMNIMLVSVTERTHEIGLRKAIGASRQDILGQFLAEAIILTVSGGILGTILALLLAAAVTTIARTQYGLDWPYVVPPSAVALAFCTTAIIGLTFGLYPARKAADMDPIEALRYE